MRVLLLRPPRCFWPFNSAVDDALPRFRGVQELCDNLATQPRVPAKLVVRDAATYAVFSNTPV